MTVFIFFVTPLGRKKQMASNNKVESKLTFKEEWETNSEWLQRIDTLKRRIVYTHNQILYSCSNVPPQNVVQDEMYISNRYPIYYSLQYELETLITTYNMLLMQNCNNLNSLLVWNKNQIKLE